MAGIKILKFLFLEKKSCHVLYERKRSIVHEKKTKIEFFCFYFSIFNFFLASVNIDENLNDLNSQFVHYHDFSTLIPFYN